MTPTEALERAIWEVRAGGSIDNTHTPEVVAALAALGWKVVPIDHFVGDDCTEEDIAHFAALEQVADRETRCARCGLTRRFLYGDRLVEHDFHFGTNLNDGHAFIEQAAEAADREQRAYERGVVDEARRHPDQHPSAAVALARCTCGSLDSVHSPTCARAVAAAVAPPTSSAEVGGSLDVEALRTALDGLDVYAYDRDLHGEPLEINEATHRIAAAYDAAIRKRDPDPTGGGA